MVKSWIKPRAGLKTISSPGLLNNRQIWKRAYSRADKSPPAVYPPQMEAWRHKDVEVLAFFIWEKNGRVEGRDMVHWLEVEYLINTSSFVPEENRIEWAQDEVRIPLNEP
jgi:hypothetical protein